MVVVLGEQKFCDPKPKSCCSVLCQVATARAGPTVQGTCSSQMSPDTISQETSGKYLNFGGGSAVVKGLLPAELLSPCLQETVHRNSRIADIQVRGNPH